MQFDTLAILTIPTSPGGYLCTDVNFQINLESASATTVIPLKVLEDHFLQPSVSIDHFDAYKFSPEKDKLKREFKYWTNSHKCKFIFDSVGHRHAKLLATISDQAFTEYSHLQVSSYASIEYNISRYGSIERRIPFVRNFSAESVIFSPLVRINPLFGNEHAGPHSSPDVKTHSHIEPCPYPSEVWLAYNNPSRSDAGINLVRKKLFFCTRIPEYIVENEAKAIANLFKSGCDEFAFISDQASKLKK